MKYSTNILGKFFGTKWALPMWTIEPFSLHVTLFATWFSNMVTFIGCLPTFNALHSTKVCEGEKGNLRLHGLSWKETLYAQNEIVENLDFWFWTACRFSSFNAWEGCRTTLMKLLLLLSYSLMKSDKHQCFFFNYRISKYNIFCWFNTSCLYIWAKKMVLKVVFKGTRYP